MQTLDLNTMHVKHWWVPMLVQFPRLHMFFSQIELIVVIHTLALETCKVTRCNLGGKQKLQSAWSVNHQFSCNPNLLCDPQVFRLDQMKVVSHIPSSIWVRYMFRHFSFIENNNINNISKLFAIHFHLFFPFSYFKIAHAPS